MLRVAMVLRLRGAGCGGSKADGVAAESVKIYEDPGGVELEEFVVLDNVVDVSRRELVTLPAQILEERNLVVLIVYSNFITVLQPTISQLQALKVVDMSFNQLTELPDEIGLLRNLEKLLACGNKIAVLPRSIGQLLALKVLDMDYNQLAALPEEIGQLINIENLTANNNKIAKLPRTIGKLLALKVLYMNDNQLTALPEEVGLLLNLEKLHAQGNKITALHASLGRMHKLERKTGENSRLRVRSNPLQSPPLSVAEQGPSAIARYFADLVHGASASRKAKTVLLGDGEGGKTSLLRGLQRGCQPAPTTEAERTIQLALSELTLGEGAAAVLLSCWDLGGQPAYASGQQQYVVRGALYVLVVPAHRAGPSDDDDGEEVLGRHLAALQARAPGAVVQLVLTHADRLVDQAEAKRDKLCEAAEEYQEASSHEASLKFNRLGDEIRALLTPSALTTAATPQLAWVRAKVAAHQERYEARRQAVRAQQRQHGCEGGGAGGASAVPEAIQVLVDDIPCVCSAEGGEASLKAARERLESIVLRDPPLLPCIGQVLPRSWQAVMASVRAMRDGRDSVAAVARAMRAVDRVAAESGDGGVSAGTKEDDPEPPADAQKQRAYCTLPELRACWSGSRQEVGAAAAQVLDDAVQLMCDQGELFVSSGLVFLDPSFATEVLKPLVEHWLSSERAKPDVIAYVGASGGDVQTLLTAIDALVNLGEVREVLLPFLWRSLTTLRREDYGSVVRMLIDGGVLFEESAAAGGEGSCRWSMPMRLPVERPTDTERFWPAEAPGAELRMQYELYDGVVPPGVPERSVARCHTLGKVIKSWRTGALVALEKEASLALLEVVPGNPVKSESAWLYIKVRSTATLDEALWQATERVVQCVAVVLSDFAGLMFGKSLVCPTCVGRGEAEPSAWNPDELLVTEGECKKFCERCAEAVVLRPPRPAVAMAVRITPSSQAHYDVFISFRFGEAHAEALFLKAALEACGLTVFLSEVTPGDNLQDIIAEALEACRLVVILATKTYGAATNGLFDTGAEMNYTVEQKKPFFLVRMIPFGETWAHAKTTMAFPSMLMQKLWLPGEPMPDDLIAEIQRKLAALPDSKALQTLGANIDDVRIKKALLVLGEAPGREVPAGKLLRPSQAMSDDSSTSSRWAPAPSAAPSPSALGAVRAWWTSYEQR